MSLSGKKWVWPEHNCDSVNMIIEDLGLSPALARLLVNRGITTPEQVRAFLCPSLEQLHSPWDMAGMDRAVERLLHALQEGEQIIIHGDYDADGIAASAILVEALREQGGKVEYYLPSRFGEGYGLHLEALQKFREQGSSLVITVDCGINAVDEIKWASENGLDVVVTDHHQPLEKLQGAVAVLNPLQEHCPYPFKELSGAGIAFKLVSALMEKVAQPFPEHLLDLAALGTTADVVPLLGENRIIVHHGLETLRRMRRTGFKALAEAVNLDQQRISSTTLSFALAPAINAAGRMGEAQPAAELLLENEPSRAKSLAESLHRANQLRRTTEQKILLEAEEAAIKMMSDHGQKIITLAGREWHHGVIGIVASRLVEKYSRPFCLVALEGEEGRGSARSIPGFDITAALAECASSLERFGGHEQAAGFTVRADQVEALRDGLNRYARFNLADGDLRPRLFIEAELDDSEIHFDLTSRLEQLQPFGTANPAPLFASRNWEIQSWRLVGADKKHLKLQLKKNNRNLDPIVFSGSFLGPKLEKGRRVDLALKLKNGYFRDQKTLEAEVKDLRYNDSHKYGSLEIIDQRGCRDRVTMAGEILDRNGNNSIVFTSTLSRAEKIKNSSFLQGSPHFITSSSLREKVNQPLASGPVILLDLPLYEGIMEHIFSKISQDKLLTIYLFYSRKDLTRNRRLLDLSLPSPETLGKVIGMLNDNPDFFSGRDLSGAAAGKIGFKPASSFWGRAEKILSEAGFLDNPSDAERRLEPGENWPSCLEASAAFQSTITLREQCERFQEYMLEASPEEIAAYFAGLAAD